jgi:outer membrane lipoprotein-sorting protein
MTRPLRPARTSSARRAAASRPGRSAVALVAAGICAALAARAGTAAELSLAARAARFPALASARADFIQEREVSLVDEVLRAEGALTLAAPDRMQLVLTAPERLTIAAAGDAVTVLDADGKPLPLPPELSGVTQFARALTDLLLGGRTSHAFAETWAGPDAVRLVPADAASPFAAIALRFPANAPLPEEVVLTERNGDRTTIRLRALEVTPRDPGGKAPTHPAPAKAP